MLIYQAEYDSFTPPEHVARVLDQVPDQTKIAHRIVENAGHFSFLSPFPDAMVNLDFPPSQDPEEFDRVAFHHRLNDDVIAFLEKTL